MDLSSTFDVLVGQGSSQQSFTVYTHVLTESSEFMRAARSSQWLADPKKPVDLTDGDPEVFSAYLNIVYRGVETVRGGYKDLTPDDSLTPTKVEVRHAPGSQQQTQGAIESEAGAKEEVLEDAFDMSLEECSERATDREIRNTTPYSIAC